MIPKKMSAKSNFDEIEEITYFALGFFSFSFINEFSGIITRTWAAVNVHFHFFFLGILGHF